MEYLKEDHKEILISNINKIHTTKMGEERIRRNLKLGDLEIGRAHV